MNHATIDFYAALQAHHEPHRHACEVRMVAAMENNQRRADYLADVRKHRGDVIANRLRADVWAELQGKKQGGLFA